MEKLKKIKKKERKLHRTENTKYRQRFITTIKTVMEYTHIDIHP